MPLAGVTVTGAARRDRAGARQPATGAPASRRSCTRGPTRSNTGYQNIQSLVGLVVRWPHRRRAGREPGQVGLPALRAHRLHLRHRRRGARPARGARRRRRCSSRSASSAPAPRSSPPTASACSSPSGVTVWFGVQAVREHRRGDRHPAHHRRAAAVRVLRRLVPRVQHDRRGAAAERGPPGAAARAAAPLLGEPVPEPDVRDRHRWGHRGPRAARRWPSPRPWWPAATLDRRSTTRAASGGSRPGSCRRPASR